MEIIHTRSRLDCDLLHLDGRAAVGGGVGRRGVMTIFLASFPPIQSAIKIGSDGMRIQLDVPESEMGNAIALLTMRDKVLKVTIEPEKENDGRPIRSR